VGALRRSRAIFARSTFESWREMQRQVPS
jgi:hypothetical protein